MISTLADQMNDPGATRLLSGDDIPAEEAEELAAAYQAVAPAHISGLKLRVEGRRIRHVECPGCRLSVRPDMLIDVRAAPAKMTDGLDWACSGCLDMWWRRGRARTRGDVIQAVGGDAPGDHPYWTRPAKRREAR